MLSVHLQPTQQEVNVRQTGDEHQAGLWNMVLVFRKLYTVALKCSWNHFIFEKYKTVQSFSYISFKMVPSCKYTLLPVTVKVLETFLEAILWEPFQFLCHILDDISSITKALPLQCRFQSSEQVKKSDTARSREYGGCSSAVTLFIAKKSFTTTKRCAGAFS